MVAVKPKLSTLECYQTLWNHPYNISFSISFSHRVNVLVRRSQNAYVHQAASSQRMAYITAAASLNGVIRSYYHYPPVLIRRCLASLTCEVFRQRVACLWLWMLASNVCCNEEHKFSLDSGANGVDDDRRHTRASFSLQKKKSEYTALDFRCFD